MSNMLTLIYRNLRRGSIRSISNYLDKSVIEIPNNHWQICQSLRIFRRFSIKSEHALHRAQKSATYSNNRFLYTSRVCWSSQIVKVPPFAESVTEGDVRIEKKVGDHVAVDEVIMEIETDKTSMPVPSPGSGIIEAIFVKDGDTVKPGMDLFKINITGEAPPAKAAAPKAAAPSTPTPPPAAAPSHGAPPLRGTPLPHAAPSSRGVPSLRRTPIPRNAVPPSSHPPQGPPPRIARSQAPPKPAAAPSSPPPPSAPSTPPPPTKPPSPQQQPMSSIPVAAIRHAQGLEAATVKVPPQDPTKEITGTRTEQRVKMNRMRQKIAQRLKEAQNVNAMLTTFNEIDMSYIMDFRKQNQEAFQKKFGIKLGFMSAFLKASAYALQDQPVVNAVIDGTDIIYRDYVDISVAVATPKGLVVPVLRNVERMNFADIELGLAALGEKARKGQIAVEDMDGGTFTISNGGVFGSLMGTPIINPPQSAILGMHGIFDRPVALKGQVVIRPMMYVALTYDHRLVDGREAAFFLKKIKNAVESPVTILSGL